MNEGFENNDSAKSAYDSMVEQFGDEKIDPESMHAFIKLYQSKKSFLPTEHAELNVKKHTLEDFSARLTERGGDVPEYITDSLAKIQELLNGRVEEEEVPEDQAQAA